ncbi:MAG: ParB/RepB/Spo0J family partition protein [Eubacteriales bacterium]|nr:ParB/RepB/Spo0J family partition protein [Eubacteriales bacterium]
MASRSRKNRGLGRGLDALFADQVTVEEKEPDSQENPKEGSSEDSVRFIDINEIKPNANQPRKTFNEDRIRELADSITEHGIIQPLVVRDAGSFYEIVAGERRWRAARLAGLRKIPCLIRSFSDEENILVAMIENLQREDLDPIEEAMGFDQMIREYGMSQEQVSKSVSKSRPYITNSLRLLKLPDAIRQMVSEGQISGGHARALLPIRSENEQIELAERIVKEGLSVRDVEKIAQKKEKTRRPAKIRTKDPNVQAAERKLREIYGTKASIERRGNKGEIRLSYYNEDDLNRLLDMLTSGSGNL